MIFYYWGRWTPFWLIFFKGLKPPTSLICVYFPKHRTVLKNLFRHEETRDTMKTVQNCLYVFSSGKKLAKFLSSNWLNYLSTLNKMTSNIQVYEPKHSPACTLMDHNGPQQPNEEAASPVRRRLATGSEAKFPQLVFEGLKVGFKGKVDFVPFFWKKNWMIRRFVSVSRYKWEKWKKILSEYMGGTCDLPGNLHIPWKRKIIPATFKGLFARAILVSGSVLFQVITFITSGKDFHFLLVRPRSPQEIEDWLVYQLQSCIVWIFCLEKMSSLTKSFDLDSKYEPIKVCPGSSFK